MESVMNDVTSFAFEKVEVFVPTQEGILSSGTTNEFKKLLYTYSQGTPLDELWQGKKPDAYYLLMRELREMRAEQYETYFNAFLDFLYERPTVDNSMRISRRVLGVVAERDAWPEESQKRDHDVFMKKLEEFDIIDCLHYGGYPSVRDRHMICKNIDAVLGITHLILTEEKCRREGLLSSPEFMRAVYPASNFYMAFLDQKSGFR